MKNILRQPDGKYHVHGKKFSILIGSRAQVGHETAYKTAGGLTRKDLKQNKGGEWVSSLKSKTATHEKRLQKYGWFTKKGKFGSSQTRKNKSRKH